MTLFNSSEAESGFRLRYMEVFNWGTFHGKVYKLKPDGHTSLLTGANGSGKTTLIDALLTLLVPSNKRFYNQSSGAEAKKERDENSYFWGYFGKTYCDTDERSKTEQLRTRSENPYSVLLACFQNVGTQHTISLAQVRWFTNGGLQKVFLVSAYPLNIEEHFGKGRFDPKGDWKKRMLKLFPKTEIYHSFKDYAARFSDLFGLKEKALSLFNQTVGIKVLGDLTTFMRHQMLEEPDAEEQFKILHNHYIDLLISHKAIQKDEKQLELLEPIVQNKERLASLAAEVATLNFIQDQFELYLEKIEFDLLDAHIKRLEEQVETVVASRIALEKEIAGMEREQKELIGQKALLNIDGQIQSWTKDINTEGEWMTLKKQAFTDYTKSAKNLELHSEINEITFAENQAKIKAHDLEMTSKQEKLNFERFTYRNELEKTKQEVAERQKTIDSLLKRKNRIPQDLIALRNRLLELLDAGEDELPFVGELLKVKEDALHWEDAIERVLHSFSLRLLVPEKYNQQINHFVHSNNLQTKLVYERIDRRPITTLRWPMDEDMLVNKLDIKEANIYSKWIEQQLVERFNYLCTDDLEVFYGSQKAVTSKGLIRNASRHEKDDRPGKWNKLRYTLGWDNRQTIQLLLHAKHELEEASSALSKKLQAIEPKLKELKDKLPLLTRIAEVKSYHEINWQQHSIKIERIKREIENLKSSSDKYKTLSAQLETLEKALSEKKTQKDKLVREEGNLDNELNRKNERKLKIDFDGLTEEGATAIEHFLGSDQRHPESLGQLEALGISAAIRLKKEINETNGRLHRLNLETTAHIGAFVHPTEKIIAEFPEWSGDVMNIKPSLESLSELEDLYQTIRNQRLVEHKRRFKDYMDKSMLNALTGYAHWMRNEEGRIKEIIEELNVPLQKITFNKHPDTYLQLECKATKEQEIRLFKEQLSATIPNALEFETQKDDAYREQVFKGIKDLITELQKEEAWRRRVTDVRNWLTFSAREYSFVDEKPGRYHDNTASYSGGEKAQFTYAILGAAIAHQFGIYSPARQHRSLRFITVDEAFSKLDPEKSEFLMEFCAQLNLQILIVTPLDKINIAEPYINAVHFVENKNKRNSEVYNLTMEQYLEKKEAFQQLAESAE